jgi:hypothetical protein
MLGMGILLTLLPFWFEATKARDFFEHLLQLQAQ